MLVTRSISSLIFLSTPSARRATSVRPVAVHTVRISIHALREEGDLLVGVLLPLAGEFLSTPSARRATPVQPLSWCRSSYFYPRPPRGGRRSHKVTSPPPNVFLSTPSARRATMEAMAWLIFRGYFYPRPPRGGRPSFLSVRGLAVNISIHALREEGDRSRRSQCRTKSPISIHALREEGDTAMAGTAATTAYFYPRPPRGGRPYRWLSDNHAKQFLSTPSARRATHTSRSAAR